MKTVSKQSLSAFAASLICASGFAIAQAPVPQRDSPQPMPVPQREAPQAQPQAQPQGQPQGQIRASFSQAAQTHKAI